MEAQFFKFQIFLFADYDEVVASPENIKFFVHNFLSQNFIPRQVQEVSLNLNKNKENEFKQELVNRIGLSSLDKKWEILFQKDFLKITYSFDFNKNKNISLNSFFERIKYFLELIEQKFTKKFNRLGLIIDYLIPLNNNEKLKKDYFLKYNTSSDFLDEPLPPIEWTNKVVVRKKITKLNNEIVNISNHNTYIEAKLNALNNEIDFKGIHNIIDINTLSLLIEKRFTTKDVETFICKTKGLVEKIIEFNKL